MKRTLLIAAAACLLATSAFAQSSAFSFQGRLTSAGAPYSGSADFQISVFDAPSGGTPVAGPLAFTNVAVASGVYTISPDFGPIFGAGARWLQVSVRTPAGSGLYTLMSPRQQVNAAPVAASLLGTSPLDGTDISQTSSVNLIGSNPPVTLVQTFKPHVSGRLTLVTLRYSVPLASSIALTVADASGVPLNTSTTFAPAPGQYDIPFYFVHGPALQAGMTYRLNISAGDGVSKPALCYAPGNPYPDGTLQGDPDVDAYFITAMDSMGVSFDQPIAFSKNVGIGTTTPASSLHVAKADGITIGRNATSGGYTALSLTLTSEFGGAGQIQAIQSSGVSYGNLLLNPVLGNVGIGRSDPDFRLDILSQSDGNALRLSSGATSTVFSLTNFAPGGANYSLLSTSAGAFAIRDVGAALDRVTLFSNGRVAIGFNSAPDARLEVRGEASSTALSAKSGPGSGAIGFYASGSGPGVKAGLFDGNVTINGNLVVNGAVSKTSGSFRIPHPLDPEHRWLSHSFVESPDMMNIYNGVVTLNEKGEADVGLPDYFEMLNRDFRYQLTPIGAPMPNLFVAREVEHNSFAVAGGKPGAKVSWSVTGIRQDDKAKSHPIVVDRTKDPLND